jgi:LuxR family maltose regulon positive regulatory protein
MKAGSEQFLTPVLNKNTVYRRKIIEWIDRLSKRGVLFVHAPAGYGKTTAVALWARYKNAVWLPLDEYSFSPTEMYRRLLSALSREVTEEFAYAPLEYTLAALEKPPPEGEGWPQAVVIDDFHLCADSQAARALPLIRSRLPAQTALVIISRNPPPDILIEQTVKGTIQQISDLQFSVDEILLLFDKNELRITMHEAEAIHRRTDGWAGALAAVILSSGSLSIDILNSNSLNSYLKKHLFDCLEDYNVLKKCSVCDTLSPALCAHITGEDNAWEIINRLADKTGLVMRVDRDVFRFHALLKEFLESELLLDETIDKPVLYKTAAEYFKKEGDIFRVADMAAKSKDVAMLEEYLRIRWDDEHEQFHGDIAAYTSAVTKYVLSEVPASVIKQSLTLSSYCFFTLYNQGRLLESFEWKDAAEKLLRSSSSQNTPADIITAEYIMSADPREDIWDVYPNGGKIVPLLTEPLPSHITFSSITSNFPFYHKSYIDFTVISPQLDAFLTTLTENMELVWGEALKPLVLLLNAGVRYERGELERSEKIAEEAVHAAQRFPPAFPALALYAEIRRVQGKSFDCDSLRAAIISTKAHYLYPNFSVFVANTHLYNGDTDTANRWLSQSEVESTLALYKIYQYFTTARALMVTGKLSSAQTLLERLAVLSSDYRRPADYIEALTLQAVCLWHMKRQADSIQVITGAIVKASELQLVMPIIKEGGDILPILSKLLNRLKYGYGADILDKSFVNILFLGTKTMSQHRGVIIKSGKNKSVKLSPRQREILTLLEQNLTYKEISAKIGIKVTTVDDHIDKLYEKLGVTNAHDAVLKAREMGIG